MSKNGEKNRKTPVSVILTDWPPERWRRHRLVLAVSGGADSVAMLRAFAQIIQSSSTDDSGANLLVVHVNHRLRSAESEGDARFVRELAEQLALPFIEETIPPREMTYRIQKLGSTEGAARELRYERLLAAAEENGARYILTAHHAEDQIETVLQRLFRGSALGGLAGIPRFRRLNDAVTLVRPMLSVRREEIFNYLNRLGQPYRTDSSNKSPAYLRNRIRNELVPLLADIFPNRFDRSLLRFIGQCREVQELLDRQKETLAERVETDSLLLPRPKKSGQTVLPVGSFHDAPDYIVREYFKGLWESRGWPLREMGAKKWDTLVRMIRENSRRQVEFPGGVVVKRINETLLLGR